MHIHATAFGLSEGHVDLDVERVGDLLAEVGRDTDGVRVVYAGTNRHPLAAERTHGIVVAMDDTGVQEAYRAHRLHAEAGAELRAVLHSGLGLDTGVMAPGAGAPHASDRSLQVHATLFRLDEDQDDSVLVEVMAHMAEIARGCPGVVAVYAGPNRTRHVGPLTHAVVVVTQEPSGMTEFNDHPLRATVGERLTAVVRDPVGLDLGSESLRSS